MAKKEAPITKLQDYLPPDTFDAVLEYLHQYKVHLTIAKERKSIPGDYRHRIGDKNHRISVNGNLLAQFIQKGTFPDDINKALLRSIHNPAASSCADETLLRTLKRYDTIA